jgi:hypothetical protein
MKQIGRVDPDRLGHLGLKPNGCLSQFRRRRASLVARHGTPGFIDRQHTPPLLIPRMDDELPDQHEKMARLKL